MKLRIALLVVASAVAFGQQSAPAFAQLYGTENPDPGRCADAVNIASTYTQSQDPTNGFSGQYLCLQSGPRSFAWAPVEVLAPGTTGTTGYAIISNGKILRVFNSLRLSGTDETTQTFPTTSATIARTDAAQTFTGTQTFGALAATTFNGNTFTTGTGILTISAGKTLTASNTLTLAGTDGTTLTFPSTSASIARTDAAQTFTGAQTLTPIVTSVAFAGLGTPTNGTLQYCSDCQVTSGSNDTCIASGSGAIASRIGGAWKCYQ